MQLCSAAFTKYLSFLFVLWSTGKSDQLFEILFSPLDFYSTNGIDVILDEHSVNSLGTFGMRFKTVAVIPSSYSITNLESTRILEEFRNKPSTSKIDVIYNKILFITTITDSHELSSHVQMALEYTQSNLNTLFLMKTNMTPHSVITYMKTHPHETKFPLSSHVYITAERENIISILEVYSVKNISVVQTVTQTDTSNKQSLISFSNLLHNLPRRYNLQKIPIIGVARPNKYYADYEETSETFPNQFVGGVVVLQYWHLRDTLNFSEGAIISTTMREGPNGTLTGYAVPINNGSVDICVSRTEFIPFRLRGPDAVAFLHPFTTSKIKAFFTQPSVNSIRDVYKSVFSIELWISLNLLWIILGIAYAFLNLWSNTDSSLQHEVSKAFMWMIGSIGMQGSPEFSARDRIKVISFTGALLGLVCFNIFSSKLFSLFSTEVKVIGQFGDLVAHKMFIYGDTYFPTARYQIRAMQKSGILKSISEEDTIVDPADKIADLIRGKSAMISNQEVFNSALLRKDISGQKACRLFDSLSVSDENLKLAMFVKRGSPFRDIFNIKLLAAIERGIRNRDFSNHNQKLELKCWPNPSLITTPALELHDIFSAFLILSGGLFSSFVFVSLELLMQRLTLKLSNKVVIYLS